MLKAVLMLGMLLLKKLEAPLRRCSGAVQSQLLR